MNEIQYPITVKGITFEKQETIRAPISRGKPGDFVAVRPCAEEHQGKTYLGIMVGDVALTTFASFNPPSGVLTVSMGLYNPAILIPHLQKAVYGCESWWSLIKSPDDMKQITDQTIENVWYVQALKAMEKGRDQEADQEAVKKPMNSE